MLFSHQWLIAAAVLLVAGNFADVVDIAVHDTYFVIDGFRVGLLGVLFFSVLWALHTFIPACRTVKGLSVFHLVATSVTGLSLWFSVLFPVREPVARYADYSVYDELSRESGMDPSLKISLLMVLLVGLQLIFAVQVGVYMTQRIRKMPD